MNPPLANSKREQEARVKRTRKVAAREWVAAYKDGKPRFDALVLARDLQAYRTAYTTAYASCELARFDADVFLLLDRRVQRARGERSAKCARKAHGFEVARQTT